MALTMARSQVWFLGNKVTDKMYIIAWINLKLDTKKYIMQWFKCTVNGASITQKWKIEPNYFLKCYIRDWPIINQYLAITDICILLWIWTAKLPVFKYFQEFWVTVSTQDASGATWHKRIEPILSLILPTLDAVWFDMTRHNKSMRVNLCPFLFLMY